MDGMKDFFNIKRKCPYCQVSARKKSELDAHIRAVHSHQPMAPKRVPKLTVSTIEAIPINGLFSGPQPYVTTLQQPAHEFAVPNYTESIVQAILDGSFKPEEQETGITLVIGGDGSDEAREIIEKIVRVCAGNEIGMVIVGQDSEMYPPLVSNIIRKGYQTFNVNGGFMISLCPGLDENIINFKYVGSNGAPLDYQLVEAINKVAAQIETYKAADGLEYRWAKPDSYHHVVEGSQAVYVEVIDSVVEYGQRVNEIFKFGNIRNLINGDTTGNKFRIYVDGLEGPAGPYAKHVLVKLLKMPKQDLTRMEPAAVPSSRNTSFSTRIIHGKYDMGVELDPVNGIQIWGVEDRQPIHVPPYETFAIYAFHTKKFYSRTELSAFSNLGFGMSLTSCSATRLVCKALQDSSTHRYHSVLYEHHFFPELIDQNNILWGVNKEKMITDCSLENDVLGQLLAWLNIISTTTVAPTVAAVYGKYKERIDSAVFSRLKYNLESEEDAFKIFGYVHQYCSDHVDDVLGRASKAERNIHKYPNRNRTLILPSYEVMFGSRKRIVFEVQGDHVMVLLDLCVPVNDPEAKARVNEDLADLKSFALRAARLNDNQQVHE